jgi:hypothetical protein
MLKNATPDQKRKNGGKSISQSVNQIKPTSEQIKPLFDS